jgi:hypothetical protein
MAVRIGERHHREFAVATGQFGFCVNT